MDDRFRALIIDDSRQIREFVIEYVLEPNGFEIEYAVNGEEGLRKALTCQPDVILLDYEMPKMSGLEVLRRLRTKHKNKVPVILMTSHGSEQIAVEVFRLGVQDYVIKPFDPQDMLDSIENALSVARLQREKDALTRRVMQVNQQLTKHLEELNTLYEVGKSISGLMPPRELLERIVDAVLLMTGSEECILALLDLKTGETQSRFRKIQPRASEQSDLEQTSSDQRFLDQLAGGANSHSGSFIEKDDDRLIALAASAQSVPLQIGNRVFGSLSVRKGQDRELTAHDNRLLQMVADYAAIAIQNMRLVRQIQYQKEQEKQQIRSLFERYVSPLVVQQVLEKPGQVSLGGTRTTLTVLFADVRGFSTFGSRVSPEILVQLLNEYLRVAADMILAQQGTLDKFMGDGVMAFFNAPLRQPDHPIRAVRAAWAINHAVKKLHLGLPSAYRLDFGIGVGLGEAVVGNVGTSQLMNYTAIGDAVNKVKRLQENAKGGQILISQVTYHMVQEYIQARSLGTMHLKGQPHPELVYEVLKVE